MAGHSKWSNIKHRKGAQDAKRAKKVPENSKVLFIMKYHMKVLDLVGLL